MSPKRRICILQHVPFEGPTAIKRWAIDRGASLFITKLYQNDPLPQQEEFDWHIVMGGPMRANDSEQYPWLIEERNFINETIESGKFLLGICLGAQLIASALGAEVKRNKYREIGWFRVKRARCVSNTCLNDI